MVLPSRHCTHILHLANGKHWKLWEVLQNMVFMAFGQWTLVQLCMSGPNLTPAVMKGCPTDLPMETEFRAPFFLFRCNHRQCCSVDCCWEESIWNLGGFSWQTVSKPQLQHKLCLWADLSADANCNLAGTKLKREWEQGSALARSFQSSTNLRGGNGG